jgi:acetolactate synthase-1/2/3 large subunit
LRHVRDVLLVGCDAPVAFFGYPDGRSDLIPPNVRVHRIASADKDAEDALQMLADELRASTNVAVSDEAEAIAAVPSGRLTPASLCATIAAILPEHAIVIDEGMSAAGIHLQAAAASAPHTYMALTGGACGMALASAIGAAIAAPDARVVTLVGDGSAMYTPQALWTQARESLDITNVVIANRGYRLLQVEYAQLQQERPDASARAMLELTSPEIEWVSVARGFGLPASRVDSIESLADRLRIGVRERGPSLIEVVL